MECFLQYLDDLDDICYAFALVWERIRRKLGFALFIATALSLQLAAVFLALTHPPIAIAAASLLLVGLMLNGVISHTQGKTVRA